MRARKQIAADSIEVVKREKVVGYEMSLMSQDELMELLGMTKVFLPPQCVPLSNLVIFLFSMHLEREKGEDLSLGDWVREYKKEMLASGMTTTYPCFFFREGLATGRSIDRTDTHHACVFTIAF